MMLPTLPNDARDGESHSRSASMFRRDLCGTLSDTTDQRTTT